MNVSKLTIFISGWIVSLTPLPKFYLMPPVILMPAKLNISWTVTHCQDMRRVHFLLSPISSPPRPHCCYKLTCYLFSVSNIDPRVSFQTTGPVCHGPMCLFHSSPIWGNWRLGRSHPRRAESHMDLRSVWTQLLHLLWQGESLLPILLEMVPFYSKEEESIQHPCVFGEHYFCDATDVACIYRRLKLICMCSAEEMNVCFES